MPEKTADLWWLFTRQTLCVTQNESVLNAALLMQNRNFRHIPVIESPTKNLVGIVSAQDVIDSLSLVLGPSTSSSEILESLDIPVNRIMSLHPIVIERGDGLTEVVKKLLSRNIGALPVVDEMGTVQGIITLRDLVGLLGTGSEPIGVKVSELMTTNVTEIHSGSTIADAVHLMSEMRIRRLPIVTSTNPKPIGMLTNKDILRLLAKIAASDLSQIKEREDRIFFNARISDIMTRDVIAIDSQDDVRIAASRMMIFGIGGLAVEDQELSNRNAGIITERDLVRRFCDVRSINFMVRSMKFELELQSRQL